METISNYQHIFQQYLVLVFYHTCTIRKVFKTLFTFIALSPFNVGSAFTLSIFLVTNLSFRSFLVAITNFRNILENVNDQSFFLIIPLSSQFGKFQCILIHWSHFKPVIPHLHGHCFVFGSHLVFKHPAKLQLHGLSEKNNKL